MVGNQMANSQLAVDNMYFYSSIKIMQLVNEINM